VTDVRTDGRTDRGTDGIAVANTAICIASNSLLFSENRTNLRPVILSQYTRIADDRQTDNIF